LRTASLAARLATLGEISSPELASDAVS